MEHFRDAFTLGKADAALAASVFHFGEIAIPNLKKYLRSEGIDVDCKGKAIRARYPDYICLKDKYI